MSYPGTWSGGLNPETDLIPLRDESIPQDVPIQTASSIVHFDIDPDNSKDLKEKAMSTGLCAHNLRQS